MELLHVLGNTWAAVAATALLPVYKLTDRDVVLIDTGYAKLDRAGLTSLIDANGWRLRAILCSHAHFDHTGGVAELCAALPRVPVYLHPADAALVGGDVFPAVGAETTPYQDGDVVKLGKMDIEVLHTPGHTPGGVTLKVGDVLLTGDTLFQGSMGRTDFEGGSYAEIMASLGRLGRLSGDYHVLPGHMGASTLEQERKTNYYLREAMEG